MTTMVMGDREQPTIPRDLRSLVACLRGTGRILCIERAVVPDPDVRGYCLAASEVTGTSLFFDNITGYVGKHLVINLLASWMNCAVMSGLPAETPIRELVLELCSRSDKKLYKPMWIETKMAPVYECPQTNVIDLYELFPLVQINDHDKGHHLHKACVVSQDIYTSVRHDRTKMGMYSLQVQGHDKLRITPSETDNLSIHLGIAENKQRPLPVAVCLGVPPLASLVASAAIGYETSEYGLISALYKHPFELTRCAKSDLSVPAYSEYLLEGYIEPESWCKTEPYTPGDGSVSGTNGRQITVTTITHRKDPILDNSYFGTSWTEHDCLVGIASALRVHKQTNDMLPEIARSGIHAEGVHLRLNVCGGQRADSRRAGMSSQEKLPSEGVSDAYKREIEDIRRQQA